MLDVMMNGKKRETTVDSGAEENVCPWGWGEEFGCDQSVPELRFTGAWGNKHRSLWAANRYG